MSNYIKKGSSSYFLLVVFITAFLFLPCFSSANNIPDVSPKSIEEHLEMSSEKGELLVHTLIQIFTDEIIYQWSAPYSNARERVIPMVLKKGVQTEQLNYLLIDASINVAYKVVKGGIETARLILAEDISLIIKEIEKKSVEKAVETGKEWLLQKEIRVSPGTIKSEYKTTKKGKEKVILQYVVVYKPLSGKKGAAAIKIYSTNSISVPKFSGETIDKIPPFIVEINGIVKESEYRGYSWVEGPSVDISFPEEVPDLGIEPLSFWERHLVKPFKDGISKTKVLMEKVTDKDILGKIKQGAISVKDSLINTTNRAKNWVKSTAVRAKNFTVRTGNKIEDAASSGWSKVKSTILKANLFGAQVAPLPNLSLEGKSEEELSEKEQEEEERVEKLEEKEKSLKEKIEETKQKENDTKDTGLTQKELRMLEEQLTSISDQIEQARKRLIKIREFRKQKSKEESQEKEPEELTICNIDPSLPSAKNKVIFNEVAWMGTNNSYADEWIELKNLTNSPIRLKGWQLMDKAKKIQVIFTKDSLITGGDFYLLERTDDTTVPSVKADLIYAGSLNNTDEELYLFDENCELQDKIIASNDWPAGDNEQKRSMERNLGWHTYSGPEQNGILGTPNAENSKPKQQQQKQTEQQKQQEEEQAGPQIKLCVPDSFSPTHPPLIINEVAWMGTADSYNNEWIELKNISDQEISLKGWQLLDQEQDLEIIFEDDTIPAQSFYLLERTDQETLPELTSDQVYTGALSNNDEALYLFNSNCTLIDKVSAAPDWPAGDNSSKKTMERTSGLEWQTSRYSGGTPSQTNSSGPITYSGGGGGGGAGDDTATEEESTEEGGGERTPVIISEVQIRDEIADHDFIELYNSGTTSADISGFQLKKKSSTGNEYSVRVLPDNIIAGQSYFLWANSDYSASTTIETDATSTQTLAKDNSLALLGQSDVVIDTVAWGSSTDPFVEGSAFSENPESGESLGREWATSSQDYIDTDNNADDFELQKPTPKAKNESLLEENQSPVASFNYTPSSPKANQEIVFDASASSDDGKIEFYQWNFDNASIATSPVVTHSYDTAGTSTVKLTVTDNDGATSSTSTSLLIREEESEGYSAPRVVINEVAWMGTKASYADEWIELYNNSSSSINLEDWSLSWDSGSTTIKFSTSSSEVATTVIPAHGFYLLERTDNQTIKNIPADLIYAGSLGNNGDKLKLYDQQETLIDRVTCIKSGEECERWPAGKNEKEESQWIRVSMERLDYERSGNDPSNWESNNTIITKGEDAGGNPILGTPKAENSILHISSAEGTDQDPYRIYDLTGLQAVNNKLDASYELANDINASSTTNWNNGKGFKPIGSYNNPFTGYFDGAGYAVSNLVVKNYSPAGLFGRIGGQAVIKNIGVVDAEIKGKENGFAGGLVARVKADSSALISNCYSTGKVTAGQSVGGLIGYLGAEVQDSYSLATIRGLNSTSEVGGLIGHRNGTTERCYSAGLVEATGEYVDGFSGVGVSDGGNNFCDLQAAQQDKCSGGQGKWTSGMKTKKVFIKAGWDFEKVWDIKPGSYPFLRVMNQQPASSTASTQGSGLADDPYLIKDLEGLQNMKLDKKAHYKLINNIDASATHNWDQGFQPVGNDDDQFLGSLNGQGYLISDLFIDRSSPGYHVGLFGYLGPGAKVKNLGLVDVEIKGHQFVGGLAGKVIGALIDQCYTTGQITASYGDAGGIIGWIDTEDQDQDIEGVESRISNCYSKSSVIISGASRTSQTSHGGGFAGDLKNEAVVENCYSTGEVIGTTTKGFISNVQGDCYGCIWNTKSSGQLKDSCAASSTTAQMKNLNTFSSLGWNISTSSDTIWNINNDYPYLRVFDR